MTLGRRGSRRRSRRSSSRRATGCPRRRAAARGAALSLLDGRSARADHGPRPGARSLDDHLADSLVALELAAGPATRDDRRPRRRGRASRACRWRSRCPDARVRAGREQRPQVRVPGARGRRRAALANATSSTPAPRRGRTGSGRSTSSPRGRWRRSPSSPSTPRRCCASAARWSPGAAGATRRRGARRPRGRRARARGRASPPGRALSRRRAPPPARDVEGHDDARRRFPRRRAWRGNARSARWPLQSAAPSDLTADRR